MSVPSTQECESIQIIEPDANLPVVTGGALGDPAIQEFGEEALAAGQTVVDVLFQARKASAAYRFDYLYVDDFGVGVVNPGAIVVVPTVQTVTGFTVELSGAPLDSNYILRWRVVVASVFLNTILDAPESLYLQLPYKLSPDPGPDSLFGTPGPFFNVFFANPRSTLTYGFAELRVENLVDDPSDQAPISVQVFEKRLDGFQIALSPMPPTANYFLAVRTP